jgi:hypothetical protein
LLLSYLENCTVEDGLEDRHALAGIEKSVLATGEPRRHRNKEHLRFVAKQPCLELEHDEFKLAQA